MIFRESKTAWHDKVVEIGYLSRPGIRIHLKKAFVRFFYLFGVSRVFNKSYELVPSLCVVGVFAQASLRCIPFRNGTVTGMGRGSPFVSTGVG